MSTVDQYKDSRKESQQRVRGMLWREMEKGCVLSKEPTKGFFSSYGSVFSASYLWSILTALLININRNEVIEKKVGK